MNRFLVRTNKFKLYGHILVLSLLISVLVVFLGLLKPQILNAKITYSDNSTEDIQFPFVKDIQIGKFEIEFEIYLRKIHPNIFSLQPDDCIDQIFINSVQLESTSLPYCDHKMPVSINFSNLLKPGSNIIRISMRNLGWPGGLKLNVSFLDPLVCSFALIFILLCYIYIRFCGKNLCCYFKDIVAKEYIVKINILKLFTSILVLAEVICGTYLVYFLLCQIHFDLLGIYTADTPMYWYGGRAVLSGLVPYIDFFETKPPGIFIISAVSYWFFDTPYLTNVISFLSPIVIFCLPIVTIYWLIKYSYTKNKLNITLIHKHGLLWSVFSVSFFYSLYSWYRSGAVQIEAIGAAVCVVFICLFIVFINSNRFRLLYITLLSLLIYCATGLKEPFLLVTFTSGLIISDNLRQFINGVLIPHFIACILGFLTLYLSGYLDGYISIYLNEILVRHIPGSTPILIRGFAFEKIWREIYISGIAAPSVFAVILFLFHKFNLNRTGLISFGFAIVKLTISLYISSLLVGLGGQYYNHHFVFPVPIFIALLIKPIVFFCTSNQDKINRLFLLPLIISTFIPILNLKFISFDNEVKETKTSDLKLRELAKKIDTIMQDCGYKKYLYLGGNGPAIYQFTDYLPSGPFFFQYNYFFFKNRTDFREIFRKQIINAEIIVDSNSSFMSLLDNLNVSNSNEYSQVSPDGCSKYSNSDLLPLRLYYPIKDES